MDGFKVWKTRNVLKNSGCVTGIDITETADWQEYQMILERALAPFREARLALADALIDYGNEQRKDTG